MLWAKYKKTANAVKAQMVLSLKQLPEKLILTEADTDDKHVLKRLIFKGFTYIFDRGFNCYTFFEAIHNKRAFFLTRLCENAVYTVEQTLAEAAAIPQAEVCSAINSFCWDKGRHGSARCFVLSHIGQQTIPQAEYLFLTNRFDLTAFRLRNRPL
jgi:hypothetical protein